MAGKEEMLEQEINDLLLIVGELYRNQRMQVAEIRRLTDENAQLRDRLARDEMGG